MLRIAWPDLLIVHFWHIPWPNREAFRVCPWQDDILDGLLGNDSLSFHVEHHEELSETVDRTTEIARGHGAVRHAQPARPSVG